MNPGTCLSFLAVFGLCRGKEQTDHCFHHPRFQKSRKALSRTSSLSQTNFEPTKTTPQPHEREDEVGGLWQVLQLLHQLHRCRSARGGGGKAPADVCLRAADREEGGCVDAEPG
ncbi:hypothetical protein VTI74DRAFT_2931 [Chaetomium olivicolor]